VTTQNREIRVRKATIEDADILLAWRNDPGTRLMFVSQQEVALTEHQAWLTSTLTREDRVLLLGYDTENFPVGVVRFDLNLADTSAAVSITVNPGLRGQGLSALLLSAAIDYLRCDVAKRFEPTTWTLRAQIRKENVNSMHLFQRVGFGNVVEERDYYSLTRTLQREL
jgi:RimJ/RimL family protein N-acetyltransferase